MVHCLMVASPVASGTRRPSPHRLQYLLSQHHPSQTYASSTVQLPGMDANGMASGEIYESDKLPAARWHQICTSLLYCYALYIDWSQERRILMNIGNRLQKGRRTHTRTMHQPTTWGKVSTGLLFQLERGCIALLLQQLQRIAIILRVSWIDLWWEGSLRPQVVRIHAQHRLPHNQTSRESYP